jgi:hypothetical protein
MGKRYTYSLPVGEYEEVEPTMVEIALVSSTHIAIKVDGYRVWIPRDALTEVPPPIPDEPGPGAYLIGGVLCMRFRVREGRDWFADAQIPGLMLRMYWDAFVEAMGITADTSIVELVPKATLPEVEETLRELDEARSDAKRFKAVADEMVPRFDALVDDITALIPDDYDTEDAVEDIILRWIRDVLADRDDIERELNGGARTAKATLPEVELPWMTDSAPLVRVDRLLGNRAERIEVMVSDICTTIDAYDARAMAAALLAAAGDGTVQP